MKKTLLLLLTLCLCMGVDAQKTKKKVKPQKAKTYVNTVTPVPADSASYAMGVLQAPSLMQYLQQREGVDSAYIGEALSALSANLTEEQKKHKTAVSNFRIVFTLLAVGGYGIIIILAFDQGKMDTVVKINFVELTKKIPNLKTVISQVIN